VPGPGGAYVWYWSPAWGWIAKLESGPLTPGSGSAEHPADLPEPKTGV
jgi:hypothetical protein